MDRMPHEYLPTGIVRVLAFGILSAAMVTWQSLPYPESQVADLFMPHTDIFRVTYMIS